MKEVLQYIVEHNEGQSTIIARDHVGRDDSDNVACRMKKAFYVLKYGGRVYTASIRKAK